MNSAESVSFLTEIPGHCSEYRSSFGAVLTNFTEHYSIRESLFDLLVITSRLYLDSLLVQQHHSVLNALTHEDPSWEPFSSNTAREVQLRRQFSRAMEMSKSWEELSLQHPMASPPLVSRDAYLQCLALHLPEIHEETIQVERSTRDFLKKQSDGLLTDLSHGLMHLGFNHALFVIPALQWLAAD